MEGEGEGKVRVCGLIKVVGGSRGVPRLRLHEGMRDINLHMREERGWRLPSYLAFLKYMRRRTYYIFP